MILLKDSFTKRGLTFKQLIKRTDIVVYQVSDGLGGKWFEVFKYRVLKPDIYHPDEFEKYPSDESFGDWAWSCANIKCIEKVLKNHFHEVNKDEIIHQLCGRMGDLSLIL